MAAIPRLAEEDAKRPTREREQLVGKHTDTINRMKAAFVRLGIRGLNPKLRNAPERLAAPRTWEVAPSRPTHWPSCSAKWCTYVSSTSRSSRSRTPGRNNSKTSHRRDQTPRSWNCNASVVSALRQRTCLYVRCSRATYGTDGQSAIMRGSQVPLTRVDRDGRKWVSPKRAMREYVAEILSKIKRALATLDEAGPHELYDGN